MVSPRKGRAQATSTEVERAKAQERQFDRTTQQERAQVVSVERRLLQQRAQLVRRIEQMDDVLLTREYLMELVQEFPDAVAMICTMDEERRIYGEGVSDGDSDEGSLTSHDEVSAQLQDAADHPLRGFIRQHWKKILMIFAIGGVAFLAWLWGPSLWVGLKAYMVSAEGEHFVASLIQQGLRRICLHYLNRDFRSLTDPVAVSITRQLYELLKLRGGSDPSEGSPEC